jgi:methionyl-tRNA formyltransferase
MRLLLLCNRDFASYYALQQLLPLIPRQTVLVLQTAQVGAPRAVPIALAALARHEQGLLQDQLSLLQGADWPAIQRAMSQQLGVPVTQVVGVNQGLGFEQMQSFQPDLMVSIRFGSILQPPAIKVPSLGVINLHSGLLPDYRGVMATFWSMLHQRSDYGYTLHHIVDDGIDTGPVIERQTLPLDLNADYFSQLLALYRVAVPRLAVIIEQLARGKTVKRLPQAQGAGGYYAAPSQVDVAQFSALGLRLF